MLRIHFGSLKEELDHPSAYFNYEYEEDWFNDPFIKAMILDVDKTEVVSAYNLISPVLGSIGCNKLSGGVKSLILAYKTNNIIDASNCGDNCAKWFIEISKIKDLTITLCHVMQFNQDFDALIMNNNKFVHTYKDYVKTAIDYL